MTADATKTAVRRQIVSMGCDLFEIGVFQPQASETMANMMLRVWDPDTLLHALLLPNSHRSGAFLTVF